MIGVKFITVKVKKLVLIYHDFVPATSTFSRFHARAGIWRGGGGWVVGVELPFVSVNNHYLEKL